MRLLVVDDDELDRLAVRRCIQQSGIGARADEAQSAEEALACLAGAVYDCVLLDYYIPGEDSLALLRQIREAAPGTPVIVFTGRGDEDIAVELMKAGVADYLPKGSLAPERLAAGVRHALEVTRAARAREHAEAELRAEEARFRTLANAIPQLAWMADAEGQRYWGNQRWYDYTGAPAGGVASWREYHHPEHLDRVSTSFRRSVESETPWEETHPLRGRDGEFRWFLTRALPITGSDGDVTGWLGTSTDITDRLRADELRAEAEKLATVRTLAGGVAHEINNRMMVALGFSQFLLDDPAISEDRRRDVLQIQRAADRTASIARQLLSYTRQAVMQAGPVSLDAAIGELLPVVGRLLGDRRLVTRLQCPDAIWIDPGHLEQIVTNLVLNARDAMIDGGTLTLITEAVTVPAERESAGRPLAPGSYGLLSIADTGNGMPPETVARIFEPFFTTKPVGQGTGLGLSVVEGLLDQSGGQVTVRSVPGMGTTFSIYFPLVPAPIDMPMPELEDRRHKFLAGATVLIVDDEPGVCEVAVRALEASGCRVLEASDGSAALDLIGRHGPPDLVLTDIMMTGIDGAELGRRIRDRWPGLPVLFMSGYSESDLRKAGALDGGATVLEKPLRPEALVDGIYSALRANGAAARPQPARQR
ncbi:MAG TPA: response regulator [Gemmatimonadales bacterium]|nr:response regulator [Gemmatimonadales bacterium]